jgi:hypothetical protein
MAPALALDKCSRRTLEIWRGKAEGQAHDHMAGIHPDPVGSKNWSEVQFRVLG